MEEKQRKDWNVYKQIFKDHWNGFKNRYPEYAKKYYNELVEKMLKCGDSSQMGYKEYRCMSCGQGRRLVSMSCKSSLCLRCGKVYVDDWISQVSKMLHEGLIYRHIVLTVPKVFRRIIYQHRMGGVLNKLFRCGAECLDDFYSTASKKKVKGGYIIVLQTHGRSGRYNVHLHIIATSGGLDEDTGEWVHLGYLPYPILHRKWQWHLLNMLRRQIGTEEVKRLIEYCYSKYPRGFVANVQKGDVPNRYKALAGYLAKYVVSPPIAVRRIDAYDGKEVTYHYRSHETNRVEKETVDVYTFIGRMVQHSLSKGFKRIRYFGVQATKTIEKIKQKIRDALSKVKKKLKDAIEIIPKKNYRERFKASTGADPLICPNCGKQMELYRIWHPKHGFIYDELEQIKKGKYEQGEEIRIQRGDRRPIRAPTRGVQIPLFGMWDGTYD